VEKGSRSELDSVGIRSFPGFRLQVVERCVSTQDLAGQEAAREAPEGFCVVAMEQTSGRGRQGRRWLAPAGSALLCSLLLKPQDELWPRVTLLAGVVVAEAVSRLGGCEAQLKWPNDVLVAGKKVAGILAEKEGQAVILGIGVNLTVDEFPPEINGVSLHQLAGRPVGWEEVLAEILRGWAAWEERISKSGLARIAQQWRALAVGLGEPVSVDVNREVIRGVAVDIQPDGSLLVETKDGMRSLYAGDVHLLANTTTANQ
jgi:BirA family biotin operon repressor/biotin-[acetyl-CoA-carboxylase] ligase